MTGTFTDALFGCLYTVWKSERGYIRDTVHKQTGVEWTNQGASARPRLVRCSHVGGDAEQ